MKLLDSKPEKIENLFCETHGKYSPKIETFPLGNRFMFFEACPKCEQEKREAEQEAARIEREAIYQRRLVSDKIQAGLGKRHIDCTFENYRTDTAPKEIALKKAKSYLDGVLDGAGNCLVMAGKVGTGKTHLAAAMVNAMVESGKSCQLIKMSELIRALKSTWSRNSQHSEEDLIDHFSRIRLLIVDEIGIQFGSDTEKLLLSEIIDNRYQAMLPTVLISNLDTDGIKQCIGERSYDRLRQDGGKIVAFDWESQRGAA